MYKFLGVAKKIAKYSGISEKYFLDNKVTVQLWQKNTLKRIRVPTFSHLYQLMILSATFGP
jgi:hypothetical protein